MSALKAVATAEHLNAHQTCATFARSDVPVGTSLFVATPPAEPGAVHCDCVIAFREGKREPEFVSWNKLPIGEHRMVRVPNLPEPGAGELADLFSRLDDVLVEESPMHPFGCASWEESSRVAIDMAKDELTQAQAKIARLEGEVAELRDQVESLAEAVERAETNASIWFDIADTNKARALSAEADAAKVREALEPLLKAYITGAHAQSREGHADWVETHSLVVNARAVLNQRGV